ncbi:MAG: Nif11-like leader peptide family natural product precursor [Synergistales bacterium]|nr:Nif11-like leader peptide family natural product precursor [Synergistales bacterium]
MARPPEAAIILEQREVRKMSMESAVAFYERLEKDTELQEKLKELEGKEKIGPYVKNDLGYDFTKEEMQKVIFERNPRMTDEDLERVVGGVVSTHSDGFHYISAAYA